MNNLDQPTAEPARPVRTRSQSLLNKAQVRKYALDVAAQTKFSYLNETRVPRFTRVSKDFYDAVEAATKVAIQRAIEAMPSSGHTL